MVRSCFFVSGCKNILKVASIYMATVIGAGFASDRKLCSFFVVLRGGILRHCSGRSFVCVDRIYCVSKSLQRKNKKLRGIPFSQRRMVIGWIMEIMVTLFMVLYCA